MHVGLIKLGLGGSSHMSLESDERPWGSWHILDVGDGFQVKRLVVKPGARLSLQSHRHRAEHWTVVTGIAECTIDDVVKTISVGESVDIPVGAKHRLANPGSETMVIIEVQLGSYTGEDDIIRHEDDYGRV
jgi:mannose-6-phosphate isomerase